MKPQDKWHDQQLPVRSMASDQDASLRIAQAFAVREGRGDARPRVADQHTFAGGEGACLPARAGSPCGSGSSDVAREADVEVLLRQVAAVNATRRVTIGRYVDDLVCSRVWSNDDTMDKANVDMAMHWSRSGGRLCDKYNDDLARYRVWKWVESSVVDTNGIVLFRLRDQALCESEGRGGLRAQQSVCSCADGADHEARYRGECEDDGEADDCHVGCRRPQGYGNHGPKDVCGSPERTPKTLALMTGTARGSFCARGSPVPRPTWREAGLTPPPGRRRAWLARSGESIRRLDLRVNLWNAAQGLPCFRVPVHTLRLWLARENP